MPRRKVLYPGAKASHGEASLVEAAALDPAR
jgi:hypothetical protein